MELFIENAVNLFQNHSLTSGEFAEEIHSLVGRNVDFIYLGICTFAAILFGFQGFAWLTQKQQTDFYHSLPVKRTERFFTIYLNGILFFLIPMLLHEVILAALLGARGQLNLGNLLSMSKNLGVGILAFLLIYHLVILAVMMTGNQIVSILAAGTFLFYANALSLVLRWHYEIYFETYAYNSTAFSWLTYLSPLSRIFRVFQIAESGTAKEAVVPVFLLLFMAAVLLLLAWKLYLMRPIERAGKALVFPKTGSVIRILIVVPVGMVIGMFFSAMSGVVSVLWVYLGSIIGVIFAHGFMETIFHFDIKAALRKKGQLLGTIVVVLAIISVFQFDLLGYDSYLPKETKIKSIDFDVDVKPMGEKGYLEIGEDGAPTSHTYPKYCYEITDKENVERFYDLIRASQTKENETDNGYANVYVCYQLENGKKVTRDYKISTAIMEEKFASIYESETGKEAIYQELRLSAKNLKKIECITPFQDKTAEFSQEESEALLDAVKKDIQAKTYQQYLEEQQLGTIELTYWSEQSKSNLLVDLAVTDLSENTLAFLENKGIYMELPNEKFEIEEIKIYDDSAVTYDGDVVEETEDNGDIWDEDGYRTLTEEEKESVIPVMLACDYEYYDTTQYKNYAYSLEVTIKNKKTGETRTVSYVLAEEDAPDSITDSLTEE
jgi:ABC-2 type transport system permease protein